MFLVLLALSLGLRLSLVFVWLILDEVLFNTLSVVLLITSFGLTKIKLDFDIEFSVFCVLNCIGFCSLGLIDLSNEFLVLKSALGLPIELSNRVLLVLSSLRMSKILRYLLPSV